MEGNMKDSKEYKDARENAHYYQNKLDLNSDLFSAGYDFAMAQPKHIFDGVAVAGEVRRFEGELVDVVKDDCINCVLENITCDCAYLVRCQINNVKYIKQ